MKGRLTGAAIASPAETTGMTDMNEHSQRVVNAMKRIADQFDELPRHRQNPDTMAETLSAVSLALSIMADVDDTAEPQAAPYREFGRISSFYHDGLTVIATDRLHGKRRLTRALSDNNVLLSLVALSTFINIVFGFLLFQKG